MVDKPPSDRKSTSARNSNGLRLATGAATILLRWVVCWQRGTSSARAVGAISTCRSVRRSTPRVDDS